MLLQRLNGRCTAAVTANQAPKVKGAIPVSNFSAEALTFLKRQGNWRQDLTRTRTKQGLTVLRGEKMMARISSVVVSGKLKRKKTNPSDVTGLFVRNDVCKKSHSSPKQPQAIAVSATPRTLINVKPNHTEVLVHQGALLNPDRITVGNLIKHLRADKDDVGK